MHTLILIYREREEREEPAGKIGGTKEKEKEGLISTSVDNSQSKTAIILNSVG